MDKIYLSVCVCFQQRCHMNFPPITFCVLIYEFSRHQLIMNWTGTTLDGHNYEKADINAKDNRHRTCLHYAAAAGLTSCVEV